MNFLKMSVHYRDKVEFFDVKGILGDEKDIEWRQQKYGENCFPTPPTQSILGLIFNHAFKDETLKILMAASALSAIIEWNDNGFKGNGWFSGTSILITFLLVTIISSISAYNC